MIHTLGITFILQRVAIPSLALVNTRQKGLIKRGSLISQLGRENQLDLHGPLKVFFYFYPYLTDPNSCSFFEADNTCAKGSAEL